VTTYIPPNQNGSRSSFARGTENFIGGEWKEPVKGQYFENVTPVTGRPFCEIPAPPPRTSTKALDAAHAAKGAWGKTALAERAGIPEQDRRPHRTEPRDCSRSPKPGTNGKPIRETLAADMPLTVDHFRYFAGCIRAQEGSVSQIDENTVAYHFHEPLGVVGQIIPWNFPILMATWKLAPALAAGNCVVLKPAEQTPASILLLMELIQDLLPPGVLNVVNGFGVEAASPSRLRTGSRKWRSRARRRRAASSCSMRRESHSGHPRARRQVAEHFLRGRPRQERRVR